MLITRELLRQWGACWSDEEIAAKVPEAGVTPLQVCDASEVSIDDRFWVLLREDIIPARELRLFACRWAASALIAANVTNIRSWRAVWTAAQYANGLSSEEQLDAACTAAWDATRAAARAAAWDARAAAWDAAWDATRAARDAARDARAAVWDAQLADVRAVLVRLEAESLQREIARRSNMQR